MSTRSAIIYKTATGYAGVYCHSEGYLSGVGKILDAHYPSAGTVASLVELGDLSVLGVRVSPVGRRHTFEKPEKGTTVAYLRDREAGLWSCDIQPEDLTPRRGKTADEVADQLGHDGWVYVFEDGAWTVNGESLRLALADGELFNSDARHTREGIATRKRHAEMMARAGRRLTAPDLDLTGDALDQTAGDFPLLSFRF